MKRALGVAVLALLLSAGTAQAAPLSPSVSYAYRLAEQNWGPPALCTSVDAQIVRTGTLLPAVGESSPAPTEAGPCFIHVSRKLASPAEFGAACLLMFNVLAVLNDHTDYYAVAMPKTCRRHTLYVWNHWRSL